jgi:ferrous iron transport protein B
MHMKSTAVSEVEKASKKSPPAYVVLTGNPNCGKTTVFNALTGLRAKVGNYAGVTVERKEGKLLGAPGDANIRVLDLPGTYSLSPQSLDEQISRDVLMNRLPELPPPDLIVVVADASNLERNLYYATQVVELGHRTIIALNMVDVAENNGHRTDEQKLSEALGVPVVPVVASTGKGIPELKQKIIAALQHTEEVKPRLFCQLPGLFRIEATGLADLLAETFQERRLQATAEALLLLSNEKALASSAAHYPQKIQDAVAAARKRLEGHGIDWRGAPIEWRYARVAEIQRAATTELTPPGETLSDRLDRVLTHKVWGTLIFVAIMMLIFQSIFTFAKIPMDALTAGVNWLGNAVGALLPPGDLRSLLVDGVIAGVGAVIVFLPQILLLFLFIGFLEDTGYMARAAFLMDRLMSKVGLHGKSFIPMLSSYACAIPGIMATRTIESPKDRLVTILVAPLMSCSARLPVYTLLIAACIPNIVLFNLHYQINLGFAKFNLFGFLRLPGLTMLAMYLLGTVVALIMAFVFKKTLLKGETPMLIMELPPYKRPLLKIVLRHMWDRSKLFLRRAGTVILGITIVLWFLESYPRNSETEKKFAQDKQAAIAQFYPAAAANSWKEPEMRAQLQAALAKPGAETNSPVEFALNARLNELAKQYSGEQLRHSFAGRMGHAIEPLIAPLGFDWRMGIGIIGSFAAREVFVSTMSTVYNVGNDDSAAHETDLVRTLREQKRPDGTPVYTTLTALTLMVFYVFALQCVSTVAVVRRETNSWKWPVFQWIYMAILAWVFAFVTYHGGRMLGWS